MASMACTALVVVAERAYLDLAYIVGLNELHNFTSDGCLVISSSISILLSSSGCGCCHLLG